METFPVVSYLVWELELVTNILWMTVHADKLGTYTIAPIKNYHVDTVEVNPQSVL